MESPLRILIAGSCLKRVEIFPDRLSGWISILVGNFWRPRLVKLIYLYENAWQPELRSLHGKFIDWVYV